MLVELSIMPIGGDSHTSEKLADILKLIDASGLSYQLTPTATCIEGNWEEVMAVVRQCHDRVRRSSPHVITMIKIEDEEGADDKLRRNVSSVEEKAGRPLQRTIPVTSEERSQRRCVNQMNERCLRIRLLCLYDTVDFSFR